MTILMTLLCVDKDFDEFALDVAVDDDVDVDDDVAVDDDANEEVAVAIHGARSRRANPTDYIKCCPARIAIITNRFVVIFVIVNSRANHVSWGTF